MKINSLYISAFGGIKDLELNFNDGLNIVYGDNENGKTTVMAFIKMMFYGSERGSAKISKNIRKKYTPWDGSAMAGSIDFEYQNKRYRLEKEFRSSNSTDKAVLCELDLGTRQSVSDEVGLKFFGLSPAAFERSVFIGQFGYPESDPSAEGEINSKLSNIALTGDENISFEAVNTRLQKAKLALMSKSGKAGSYDKNVRLFSELKQRFAAAAESSALYKKKKDSISLLESEVGRLQTEADELKVKISAEQDVRNAEKLKKLLVTKEKLDALNENLRLNDGSVIDEIYLRKLQFCISKVDSAESKLMAKKAEMDALQKSIAAAANPPADATEQNAEQLKSQINQLLESKKRSSSDILEDENRLAALEKEISASQNRKKKVNLPLLIIGIVALVAAAITLVANFFIPAAAGLVVAVALMVLAFIIRPINKKAHLLLCEQAATLKTRIAELRLKQSSLTDEISSASARLEAINAVLSSSAVITEKQQELLSQAQLEYNQLTAAKVAEESTLAELFGRYKPVTNTGEIISALDEIAQKAQAGKQLKTELNLILGDLGSISYEEAREKLAAVNSGKLDLSCDFDALKAHYEQLLTTISELKTEIATLFAESKAVLKTAENPEELKSQIKTLSEKIASQKSFCDAIDLASDALLESYSEIRRSYGSVLEKKAADIFSSLTGGKYSDMSISKAFEINVSSRGSFGSHEIDYLSSGTADQAYLSLRLAFTELICDGGESLPLLLDDALAQYDDARMQTAMKFLADYSQNGQIIMFTCHHAICEAAKEFGTTCTQL